MAHIPSDNSNIKLISQRFSILLVLLIPLGVLVWVLADRSTLLRPLSLILRTGFTLVAPAVFGVLYLVFRLPGRWGWIVPLSAAAAIFGLSLAGLWASGQSQSTALSGIIPLSDANNYYSDAQRLLAGRGFEAFSAWRPLFPGLLAGMLLITGGNLAAVLGALAGMAALACFLLAVEIRRTHGPAAAALVLLVLFLYYRQRIGGMALSENLGLALGALGLALMWKGTSPLRQTHVLLGLFGISAALNTRPGAFFVLPCLLLWYGWQARGEKTFNWRFFLFAVAAVALGFALNLLVLWAVSSKPELPFSNFSYTLYGLAAGGKGWSWIQAERPDVMAIQGFQRHLVILSMTWELVRQNPLNLAAGFWHEYRLFFSNSYYSLYGFAGGENTAVTLAARLGLFGLCGLGLARCAVGALKGTAKSQYAMLLAGALGMLLSVAFVPPGDAYGMRLYAATMPLAALLPAIGVDWISAFLMCRAPAGRFSKIFTPTAPGVDLALSSAFLVLLIAASLVSPLLIRALARAEPAPAVSCPPGQTPAVVDFAPGAWVRVIREDVVQLDWLPEFHAGRFRWNIHGLPDSELVEELDPISIPALLFTAVDQLSNRSLLLIADGYILPAPPARLALCGVHSQSPAGARYGIFYVRGISR